MAATAAKLISVAVAWVAAAAVVAAPPAEKLNFTIAVVAVCDA